MNKHSIMLGLSIIIHFALLIVFLLIKDNLDVFTLIAFIGLPILVNVLFSYIGTKIQKNNVSSKNLPIIITYVAINLLYWFYLNVLLKRGNTLEDIYESSKQYNSDMIEVSAGNSPIGALAMLLLVSFVLYYFSIKIASKRQE